VPGRHGTLADVTAQLDYVAGLGFDVLYLPPIHPIGEVNRKGRNNARIAAEGDVGSPWAIGSHLGGHTDIHPDLGDVEDMRRLVAAANDRGMEVALDIALQCAPDHPYVKEHPEWFWLRPDGTVQYAENPPKKYEDIYPFDFETDAWRELWDEVLRVFRHWVDVGVRIFRVDNPHTKPFGMWEWVIAELKREHPDVLFLSEAFTRPKVMQRLAALGFSQSYTYFAWRNSKWEIEQYFTELTQTELRDYVRPNLWPNTPDILNAYLQDGGRPAFAVRFLLAATLGANYGIYGPAFELCEHVPREPGSEEYRDSEKYQIRTWDLEREDSLAPLIRDVNAVRRAHPAFRADRSLRFHHVDNNELVAYSKSDEAGDDVVLVFVNLDPGWKQSGWTWLQLDALGIDPSRDFQVEDVISGARYTWHGPRNFVALDPVVAPGHILVVTQAPAP